MTGNAGRKERYRTDPEYRALVNQKNRERYHANKSDPLFRKIHFTRARIDNGRFAIQHHQERLEFFHSRVIADVKLLDKMLKKRKGARSLAHGFKQCDKPKELDGRG